MAQDHCGEPIDREKTMKSVEWGEGFTAFKRGSVRGDCPYGSKVDVATSRKRTDWFAGYFDAMHLERWPDWLAL